MVKTLILIHSYYSQLILMKFGLGKKFILNHFGTFQLF